MNIELVIYSVRISSYAIKQLKKVPRFIVEKLEAWVDSVEQEGLEEIRKIPGFHDEALQGSRKGQRSIRLNRAYRAIYVVCSDKSVEFVLIEEVSKHEY